MTSTKTSYPTGEEVEAFLLGHSLTLATALTGLLPDLAAAAAADFERAVQRQMLADSTAALRYYDPPTHRNQVLQVDDLAAAPTLVQYAPTGSTAQTWTLGTDYRLEPANALAKGQPLRMLRLLRGGWTQPLCVGQQQSIQITGRWGYGTTLPEDVWTAVCMRAAWSVWSQVTFGATGGVLGWKDEDRSMDYGVERWTGPLKVWCGDDGEGGVYGRTVNRYRKVSF